MVDDHYFKQEGLAVASIARDVYITSRAKNEKLPFVNIHKVKYG